MWKLNPYKATEIESLKCSIVTFDDLKAENEQLRAERMVWQPIETVPRDETNILVWGPAFSTQSAYFTTDGEMWTIDGTFDSSLVTHWMPLPEPPTPR